MTPWPALCALAAALTACATPPAPAPLTLLPALTIHIADMEAEVPLTGGELIVPKPARPRVPASEVRARRDGEALTLSWKDAWLAAVRLDSEQPLDLRGYLEGTLEFDVQAGDLSKSGLSIAMSCGPDCGRRVNFVVGSRALSGRGWQHLSVPLHCFMRDGADFAQVKRPFVLESSGSGEVSLRKVQLLAHGGTPNVPCTDWRTQSVTAMPLQEVWSLEWWMPRHEKKLAEIRAQPDTRLVFIGDSITHGWEDAGAPVWKHRFAPHKAINLGYGGDRTENVLWRLQHGELDGMAPKLIVMMIGTNNTGDRQEDPATTAAGIRRLLDEIATRQPQARVLLLGLFPRDPKPDTRLRRLNRRVNELIERSADGRRVFFLDIGAQLTEPDGTLAPEIFPDWLHLSEAGYERWARAIAPMVERLLAQP